MRRLARRLFTLCSAASLLLCVAMCVLWAESYATDDDGAALIWQQAPGDPPTTVSRTWLVSSWGRVWLCRDRFHVPALDRLERALWAARLAREPITTGVHALRAGNPSLMMYEDPVVDRLGVVLARQGGLTNLAAIGGPVPDDNTFVGVPHWMMILLFAALPLRRASVALSAGRRRRRARLGHCRSCGYDLRASPGRCPECGAAAAAAAAAASGDSAG